MDPHLDIASTSVRLSFEWCSNLASGKYNYRLTAGEFVVSKKMQLIKLKFNRLKM